MSIIEVNYQKYPELLSTIKEEYSGNEVQDQPGILGEVPRPVLRRAPYHPCAGAGQTIKGNDYGTMI